MTQRNFTKAFVRAPAQSLVDGITQAGLGLPDYARAVQQHRAYIAALEDAGLQVVVIPADERYPDCVFIEDTALLTEALAIITRPGALSRRGEVDAVQQALAEAFTDLRVIQSPATLDAGDVMQIGDVFYVGLSARTDQAGVRQLADLVADHGLKVQAVAMPEILHLKTGVNYLGGDDLIVSASALGYLTEKDAGLPLKGFNCIVVPDAEAYAANALWLNGTVLVPAGFPRSAELIDTAGYSVQPLAMSEFQKLDGGLSCLSLRI